MLPAMSITVDKVSMSYPLPRRLRTYLCQPRERSHSWALQGITFSIASGEAIGLLGVNGSGKTTLLKLLGGLLYPTEGTITVQGRDTQQENLAARSCVGYVLNEDRSFYWRLTGKQNLEFFGALDNLWGRTLQQRIDDVLALVELTAAGEKTVAGYSSGMRQRLAIARSLLANPDILILDEPTRTLDPQGAEHFLEMMDHFAPSPKRRTLVIATHRFAEAEALCDRLMVLVAGRIVADASREDILAQYGSVADFYHQAVRTPEEMPC